jgi:hypothetical protein
MGETHLAVPGERSENSWQGVVRGELAVGWNLNSVVPAEVEFAAAQQLLCKHGDDARFDKPIKSWFTAADRHLFRGDYRRSLRNVLSCPFADVSTSLANDGMSIVILVSAIKRACRDLARPSPTVKAIPEKKPACGTAPGKEDNEDIRHAVSFPIQTLVDAVEYKSESEREALPSLDELPAGLWAGWCRTINVSRLDRFPLGFYAASLRNLPARLWEVRISAYSKRSFEEVYALGGHGENAVLAVVKIISGLARTLDCLPEESHNRVLIVPSPILDVTVFGDNYSFP